MTIKDRVALDSTPEIDGDERECKELAAQLIALQGAKTSSEHAAEPYWRMDAARLISLAGLPKRRRAIYQRKTKGKLR